MVVTTPKSINSLNPSVYLAQDNSEIRYKLLMFNQEARRAQQTVHRNLKDILNAAFQSVTPDFCKAYIKDCGY